MARRKSLGENVISRGSTSGGGMDPHTEIPSSVSGMNSGVLHYPSVCSECPPGQALGLRRAEVYA